MVFLSCIRYVIFILSGLLLEAYVDEWSKDATVYIHLQKLVLILSQAKTQWIGCVQVEPCQKKLLAENMHILSK